MKTPTRGRPLRWEPCSRTSRASRRTSNGTPPSSRCAPVPKSRLGQLGTGGAGGGWFLPSRLGTGGLGGGVGWFLPSQLGTGGPEPVPSPRASRQFEVGSERSGPPLTHPPTHCPQESQGAFIHKLLSLQKFSVYVSRHPKSQLMSEQVRPPPPWGVLASPGNHP